MDTTRELIDAAIERVTVEAEGIMAVAGTFDDSTVEIIKLLATGTGKAFITGSGTSGAIARRMAHLFSVCGTPAAYLHPSDALHGTMGVLQPSDVLLAISRGGESAEINELARRARDQGVVLVALTNERGATLARIADHVQVFRAPSGVDPGDVLAMGTTLMHAAWGDAVAIILMRIRGYSWADVLFTHPSGSVGMLADEPPAMPALTLP